MWSIFSSEGELDAFNLVRSTLTLKVSNKDLVISDLNVVSGKDHEILPNGLAEGTSVYIDRSYWYNSAPAWLEGSTDIKTVNDD